MLDYAALNALAAVVREGSFDRAARALHVTPSAVSQRVRLLEQELTDTLPVLVADGPTRVPLPVAVNADSLATWFAPALAAFAADAPVLVELSVDDQDHTAEWLRTGAVVAAVTSAARPATGCNSRPLGVMRYLAAASPAYVARYLAQGVGAGSLAQAPSLLFNTKDELQATWVRRLCHRHVELPRHTLPSPQAFVTAALAGMGWGMFPQEMVADHLTDGLLVELVPDTPLDVPLYWQTARAASGLLDGLTRQIVAAARAALLPERGS